MSQAQIVTELGQAYAAGALSFRNRLINGACRINQRGNGIVHAANSPSYSAADRWYAYSAGSSAASYNDTFTPAGDSALRVVQTSAGNTAMAIGQRIESLNTQDLANQQIVVTAWLYCTNASPTFTCNAYVYANKDNPGGGGAWANGNLDVPVSNGNWYFVRSRIQLPANAINGFGIEFGFPAIPNGAQIALGGAQLEGGYTASPFERRPVGIELMLCQRYYVLYGQNVFCGQGAVISTSLAYENFFITSPLRAGATITATATAQLYTGSGIVNVTGFGTIYGGGGQPALACGVNTAAVLTGGQAAALYTNNSLIILNAEL